MSSTFLTLRYIAFTCFILFNSVICVVAALNLGSLAADTEKFPEVDSYLIFTGAFTIAFIFPVIFIEQFRKNAFVCRVGVEIAWVAIFWIMALAGAAAVTAISPQMHCAPNGPQLVTSCTSTKVLLAFTWLSTIAFLTYLLGLTICAVYHNQQDSHIWQSGVRDFQWFTRQKSAGNPPEAAFTYGKIVDPREPSYLPPIYAQQIGLSRGYVVEPLRVDPSAEYQRPTAEVKPPLQHATSLRRDFKFPAPPTPVAVKPARLRIDTAVDPPNPSSNANATRPNANAHYSLYPQIVQALSGQVAQPPPHDAPTPPPIGEWPRSNPQEPLRRKPRPVQGASQSQSHQAISQEMSSARPLPPVSRPRPGGPRHSSSDRHRPPPLDLNLSYSKQ